MDSKQKPLHWQYFDDASKEGDHIELLSDRFTDKGPCTGIVTNVSGGMTCVKHHDEYFWLPNDRVEIVRVGVHHRTGKTLWIIK